MARPAHANPEATRRKLLDVAIPRFAQTGYHGTSTRKIAAAARVNLALIHHYFDSKRGLYEAVVSDVYRRLGERTTLALAELGSADFDALLTQLYAVARAERDGVRLLVREVLDHGHLTPFTEATHFLPEIDRAAGAAAVLLGVPPARARTAAVTIGYLLSRFVIQDDKSLVTAFGVRTVKEAHARVVATLSATARALFAGSPKE